VAIGYPPEAVEGTRSITYLQRYAILLYGSVAGRYGFGWYFGVGALDFGPFAPLVGRPGVAGVCLGECFPGVLLFSDFESKHLGGSELAAKAGVGLGYFALAQRAVKPYHALVHPSIADGPFARSPAPENPAMIQNTLGPQVFAYIIDAMAVTSAGGDF